MTRLEEVKTTVFNLDLYEDEDEGPCQSGLSARDRELIRFGAEDKNDFNHCDWRELVEERLDKYQVSMPSKHAEDTRCVSGATGDDGTAVALNPAIHAVKLCAMEHLMKFQVSEKDTAIMHRLSMYAQEMGLMPDNDDQTYESIRKRAEPGPNPFLDVGKVSLALNCKPNRLEHSSTIDGKATMMSSRLAFISKESPAKAVWEVLNLAQDITHDTLQARKNAYFPTGLGGLGKMPPFGMAENELTFLRSYKRGRYAEYYYTLMAEFVDHVDDLQTGKDIPVPIMLAEASKNSPIFHDWFKSDSNYLPVIGADIPEEIQALAVGQYGKSSRNDEIASRLVQQGKLISEDQVQVCLNRINLTNKLVSSKTHNEFMDNLESERKLRREVAVHLSTNFNHSKPVKQTYVSVSRVSDFLGHYSHLRMGIRNMLRSSLVFPPDMLDVLYKELPCLRVPMVADPPGLPVEIVDIRDFYKQEPLTQDSVDLRFDTSVNSLQSWYLKGCLGNPPDVYAVNDDLSIIEQAMSLHGSNRVIAVVTADKRLCASINIKTEHPVVRVPPGWYKQLNAVLGVSQAEDRIDGYLSESLSRVPTLIIDTGALEGSSVESYGGMLLKSMTLFRWSKNTMEKDEMDIFQEEADVDQPPPEWTPVKGARNPYLYDKRNATGLRQKRVRSVAQAFSRGAQVVRVGSWMAAARSRTWRKSENGDSER